MVLHVTDYAQTRHIAANPELWHEQNSILGLHPTPGNVDRYFLATALIHGAVAYYLPAKWRKNFQQGTIAIEASAVAHNYSIGISAKF